MAIVFCDRCGVADENNQLAKRIERGRPALCSSCLAKPMRSVVTGYGVCRPWHGDFDDDDNPLDDEGQLYRAGVRLCRKRDCVERSHIVDPVIFEALDRSYITGVKLTPYEILDILDREQLGRPTHG